MKLERFRCEPKGNTVCFVDANDTILFHLKQWQQLTFLFPLWVCESVLACFSYQTVTVDDEGKLSRDVVHEAVRGRWGRAVQLFNTSLCCLSS